MKFNNESIQTIIMKCRCMISDKLVVMQYSIYIMFAVCKSTSSKGPQYSQNETHFDICCNFCNFEYPNCGDAEM